MRHSLGPCGALLLSCILCPGADASPVFINEFHYDNTGGDRGEFVEIAGPAGTDLGGWQVLLYNGENGLSYRQLSLSGVLGDDTGTGFGFLLLSLPSNGLQNGPADGLALLDADHGVREFFSYEGVLSAADGLALGLVSRDIGVAESGSTPVNGSLQRVGRGRLAGDFIWQAFDVGTPGGLNHAQRLVMASLGLGGAGAWSPWLVALLWLARRGHCCDNGRRAVPGSGRPNRGPGPHRVHRRWSATPG